MAIISTKHATTNSKNYKMSNLLNLLSENKNMPLSLEPYMVLDVETRRSAKEVGGWHNAADMGVSIAVLYDSSDDSFTPYTQDELGLLFNRLTQASRIIGFNIVKFDYSVLQPFCPYNLQSLPTLDLLLHIQKRLSFRVSLDNIAKASLNIGKSSDGMQALTWWKQGRLSDITQYCTQDVDITRRVYLYGLKNGYIFFTNKKGKNSCVAVDFKN